MNLTEMCETVENAKNEIIKLREINADLLEACRCAHSSIRRGWMFDTKLCGEDTGTERDMIKVLLEQAIDKAEE